MNIQPAKTVYCIAVDPDPIAGGVGGSSWNTSQEQTDRLFQQMGIDPKHDGDTLIRFDLQVPASATPEQITELVDAAAWEHDYEAVRTLTVAVEH